MIRSAIELQHIKTQIFSAKNACGMFSVVPLDDVFVPRRVIWFTSTGRMVNDSHQHPVKWAVAICQFLGGALVRFSDAITGIHALSRLLEWKALRAGLGRCPIIRKIIGVVPAAAYFSTLAFPRLRRRSGRIIA